MTPLYLRSNELGPFLGMSEANARKLLARFGIKPVDLGRGRGNGLRWRTSAVIQVADTLHAETQKANGSEKHRKPAVHALLGKTPQQLAREFQVSGPLQ